MAVGPGSRLGTYEVVAAIGAGGMGEVYRARDLRLHREVALKVLPELFAADNERLARFEREAQALAALKHPHIATIYGIEDKDGVHALVLELVEGETLAEIIARGPVPPDEAIRIARQIADALDAAHEHGIIHRDLKPANVKLTPDGTVKVLDFGLAKLESPAHPAAAATTALSMSPTITSPAMVTGAMVLMGTAGYMAPEQARGKPIDRRADIWAFGVVFYEMLVGRRAFEGESVTELIGAVIHKEPDWSAFPADVPPTARRVIERCLQKDPKQRLRDMGDVRLALEGAFATPVATTPAAAPMRPGRRLLPIAAALIVGALAAGGAIWALTRTQPADVYPIRFEIPPPAPRTVAPLIELSPDGRSLAFVALDGDGVPRVWVRPLGSTENRLLTPRDDTRQPVFWSRDGRHIAFVSENKIKKVAVDSGVVETIADGTAYSGGTWNADNVILVATGSGIMRVPATGGTLVPVTAVDKSRNEAVHVLPRFLPDGKHFLYLKIGGDTSGIYVGALDTAPADQSTTRLLATGQNAIYAGAAPGAPGYLLFLRDGLLTAQQFDETRLQLVGEPITVGPDQIETATVLVTMTASENGTLAYRRGVNASRSLATVDATGKPTPLLPGVSLENARYPRASPDGRQLSIAIAGQLWTYDLAGSSPMKLTFDGGHYSSVWTRDGKRLVMEKDADSSGQSLFVLPSDGSSAAVQPFGPTGHFHPHGWSAEGELVATRVIDGGAGMDLVRFAPTADAKVIDIVATPALEGASASVSPDGRWIAYTSNETGEQEIWVRPVAGNAPAVRVSSNSGTDPVWAKNGRELYFVENIRMMAVEVTPGDTFNFKVPRALFSAEGMITGAEQPFDTLPDGRFVTLTNGDTPDFPVSVIINWTQLLANRSAGH